MNSFETKIIGKNKNYLITLDNKIIPIEDIIDIDSELFGEKIVE